MDTEKPAKAENGRNYGIDLLRIIAMLLVVVLHVLGRGGVLANSVPFTPVYEAAWFMEIAAYCAVDCYALISGYVGIKARYRYSSIVVLWLRVVFYAVTIPIVFNFISSESVDCLSELKKALFPVMTNKYWYFTQYFLMFFLLPFFNLALEHFDRRQMRAALFCLLGLYSLAQVVFQSTVYGCGYDAVWLSILYLVGGYIRKYDICINLSAGEAFAGYGLSAILIWLTKAGIEYLHIKEKALAISESIFVSYNSPLVFIEGVLLLLLCRNLHLPAAAVRVIKKLSPLAFSVYVIHSHSLIWDQVLLDRFAAFAELTAIRLVPAVLGTALGIWLLCAALDIPREYIFRRLAIKQRLEHLENKLLGNLWS